MQSLPQPTRPSTLPDWGSRASDVIRNVLRADLRGLYLIGSAVSGGLRQSSDLDLLAIVADRVAEPVYGDLSRHLLEVSSWCLATRTGRPIELTVLALSDIVPWRYPPRRQFQFGEWLRPELERGQVAPPADDPDVAIMLTSARASRASNIALHGPPLVQLIDPVPLADLRRAIDDALPQLTQAFEGDERNVILTLARMWVTLSSGEIVPKDVAADRMLIDIEAEHRAALSLARRAYRGEAADDWAPLQPAVRSFIEYAGTEIRRLLSQP